MDSAGAVRGQGDLAEMVELLLDKGVVVNADVVVSVGDTELLGVEIRAAVASFETAAEYGLEFPEGTDRERIEAAAQRSGDPARRGTRSPTARPDEGGRPGVEPDAGGGEEDGEEPRLRDVIFEDAEGEDGGDDP